MRILVLTFLTSLLSFADTPAPTLWKELEAKRAALPFQQSFDVVRTHHLGAEDQTTKYGLNVFYREGKWRESPIGWGMRDQFFDGTNVFTLDQDAREYLRRKAKKEGGDFWPSPYCDCDGIWSKMVELKRRMCGLSGEDHECVEARAPIRTAFRGAAAEAGRVVEGIITIVADTKTGLFLQYFRSERIETPRLRYVTDTQLKATTIGYTAAPDSHFLLPAGWKEVKRFDPWTAKRLEKIFLGQRPPQLDGTDLQGKPFSTAEFLGKTVLLDFWATWCPPCRADSPSLNKLQEKYGDRELVILGISVGEERAVVQDFLKDHKTSYRVGLSTTADLPIPYQVNEIPTYVVIDASGKLTAATSGDQGFSHLRKMLKKAGLDVE